MSFLTAESADLGHRHSDDSDSCECFLHVVELERLDDRLDLFHMTSRRGCLALAMPESKKYRYASKIRYLSADGAESEGGLWLLNRQAALRCLSNRQGGRSVAE
jgi:hypothetical protein